MSKTKTIWTVLTSFCAAIVAVVATVIFASPAKNTSWAFPFDHHVGISFNLDLVSGVDYTWTSNYTYNDSTMLAVLTISVNLSDEYKFTGEWGYDFIPPFFEVKCEFTPNYKGVSVLVKHASTSPAESCADLVTIFSFEVIPTCPCCYAQ